MEYRIYANGKLVNICTNDLVLGSNLNTYYRKYGKENVELKKTKAVMDEEKKQWLDSL